MRLSILPLLNDLRFLAIGRPSTNCTLYASRRFSSSIIASSNKNCVDEDLDYFKMGKLADYPVPEKVKELVLKPDSPSKFLDRIRFVKCFGIWYDNEILNVNTRIVVGVRISH